MDDVIQLILAVINEVGIPVGMVFVLIWFLRRVLSMWREQQTAWNEQLRSRDDFQQKLLDRYIALDQGNDSLKTGQVDLAQQIIALQKWGESFSLKTIEIMEHMDSMIAGQNTYAAATTAKLDELKHMQNNELSELRQELKEKMDNIEQGNHNNGKLLAELVQQLSVLTQILTEAKLETFADIPARINSLLAEIQSAVQRVGTDETGEEQS